MDTTQVVLSRRMRSLWRAFAEELPYRVERTVRAFRELASGEAGAAGIVAIGERLGGLAGSSEALGFEGVADTVRRLELLLRAEPARSGRIDERLRRRIESQIEDLEREAARSAWGRPGVFLDLAELDRPGADAERSRRVLYLLSRDGALAADLGFELGCFGYLVRRFDTLDELAENMAASLPCAVLIDVEPFAERMVDALRIDERRSAENAHIPIFFLTSRTDFASRLAAVRAGGDAYLLKPLETRRLVERLESSNRHAGVRPWRVLVVSGDWDRGLTWALALQGAGISTEQAGAPAEVWKSLVAFRPEALLIDARVGDVSGLQLAAVIRQQEGYDDLALLLVADSGQPAQRVDALRWEIDEVLPSPLPIELLVTAIGSHVQRIRSLRRSAASDGLTGLWGYSWFLDKMVFEVDYAIANRTQLSLATIDIDRMQAINDAYGHLTGDSVLRGFGRLIEQRLRRTDVIGRQGGDEFGVIFPGTAGSDAEGVMESLRSLWAEFRHHVEDETFTCTFSCGVASLSEFEDGPSLRRGAAQALREARRQGGNRVLLARR